MLHGGDVYNVSKRQGIALEEFVDFSANINPLGMPESVKASILDSLDNMIHYPDPQCSALKAAIAAEEKVKENQILCGNGAADLIYRICYGLRPQKALLLEPTFLEYREALWQQNCHIETFLLKQSYHVTEDVLQCLTPELDILFICNPNNPTGLLVDVRIMRVILQKAKENDIVVVLDECFLNFVEEGQTYSMQPYLEQYDNLLILKSFTKMYALPGIRLGYLLSSNHNYLEKIQRAGQTWSVNSLAQAAGVQALKEKDFVEKTVEYIEKEAEFLRKQLADCGFFVYNGKANYLFFRAEEHLDLYDKLLNQNIIIRKCSNYKGLEECHYRVAVRCHKDNEKLASALKRITGNED